MREEDDKRIYTLLTCFDEHKHKYLPEWKVTKSTDKIIKDIGHSDVVWDDVTAKRLYASVVTNAPARMVYFGFDCEIEYRFTTVSFIMQEDATKVKAIRRLHEDVQTVIFTRNPIWDAE